MTERIYLDYASSTPVHPEVEAAMQPYFSQAFGNPGSLHSFGQEAIRALDQSREDIAKSLGADFREVIFTGSATEANNLAIRGAVRRFWREFFKKNKRSKTPDSILPQIISSAIEHESVLETLRDIELRGAARVTIVPVEKDGRVDVAAVERALTSGTILVSVMYASNEIGTIQPIAGIAKLIADKRRMTRSPYPLLHTDAAQALQFLDCNVRNLGVDLMTLSSHKIYGPKGIGGLFVKQGVPLDPLITGGGQEFGMRSGTENIPSVVGFAKAVELIQKNKEEEAKRLRELSEYFLEGLRKIYPRVELNGPKEKGERLPNILNIYFPDYEAKDLLLKFDLKGLAVSAGSACKARSVEPSYMLRVLGLSKDRVKKSIRISFGRPTTKSEIDKGLEIIKIILK